MDFATSTDSAVQRQLDRLGTLSVPDGRLGLGTIRALLARLGDPHLRLPPAFHVAGTNGKGSTCAFLRAMLEGEGYRVHVTTSPHLVRYNERIRVAGELISDARLAKLLAEVLDAGEELNPSFFEVTIAAAFLEFARVPADACVIEVGLGGRFDATNVLENPAACGIASLGIDHERFLLAPEAGTPEQPMARIAFEKAGIAKRGVPLVTLPAEHYPPEAHDSIAEVAFRTGAPLNDTVQCVSIIEGCATLLDCVEGEAVLRPALPGLHQLSNAALAATMLLIQDRVPISPKSIVAGALRARWPARLQRLSDGPLTDGRELWLDGGHNSDAGAMLARHFAGRRVHLVIGMLANKNPAALLGPMRDSLASVTAVPVPRHDHHPASAFGGGAAPDVPAALEGLPRDALPVLVAGSLYLAGEVLRLNGELPD